MRKHFLLLFLMALLPLAGWAADHEVEVTLSSSPSIVWQGFSNENKPAVQKAWITVKENGSAVPQNVKNAVAAALEFRNLDNYNVGNHSIQLQLRNANVDYVEVSGEDYYIVIADATRTLTITKLEGDVVWTGATPSYVAGDLTYTGDGKALLAAGAEAKIGDIYVPVSYTLNPTPEQGDPVIYNSFDAVEATNAGEYTVYYKVIGTDNYDGTANWVQMTSTKVIDKATNTISGLTHANWTYNPEKTEPSATGENPDITVTATVGAADAVFTYAKWNGSAYGEPGTYADIVGGNAGKYKLIATIPATNNYTEATSNVEFTIAKATNSITDLTLAGWTYDPAKTEPVATGENPAITFTATYGAAGATFSYKKGSGEYGTWDDKVGGHAGSYTLKATIAESDNYEAGEAEVAFTIAKATPVLDVEGVVNTAWNLYDGGNHNLFLKRATATIGETTLGNTAIHYNARYKAPGSDSYSGWFGDKTNPTNSYFTNKKDAGSYQVQIWVDETDDYNAVYHKPNNQFARIDVAKATIPAESFNAPEAATGLKADGNAHALVTAGSWGENPELGTFQYSLDNDVWSADVPQATATAAGNYSVYYKIVPTNTNATNYQEYVAAEPIAVTIGGYIPVYIVPTAAQKYYGTEDPASFEYTVENANTGEVLANEVLQGTVSLARTNGNAIGTYKIYVKGYTPAAEDGEYTVVNILNTSASENAANKTAPFTILVDPNAELKLNFTADAIATKASKVYDGTTSIEALGFTVDDLEADETTLIGEDTWESLKGSANVVFALAAENGNVQETQVTATVSGGLTARYATVTVTPMNFEITPAAITLYAKDQAIDWSADPTAQPNTTVEDETVAIAVGALKGTDALTDVVASINIASTNVGDNDITLTATDNANYNITVNSDGINEKKGVLTITGAATLVMSSDYDADADWYQTIKDYDTQLVTVKLTVNRTQTLPGTSTTYTWNGEDWNAFILPFDITPRELSEAFGYAIVNVVNPAATKDGNIAFKLNMSQVIPANTPFMLKNYEAVAPGRVINFGAKTIVAPASEEVSVDAGENINFIGSYNTKTIGQNMSNLYFYNGEGAWKHLKAATTTSWNIAPFNAYMLMPATGGAHEYTFTFEEPDGSTTAIRSISEDATGTNAKGWYTLNGVKMQNAPTQKGVYIKDGKKVVIK